MTKKRIMLIDDHPKFTQSMKIYLESTGAYEVREVNSGIRALAAVRHFKPDLILLDIIMPGMDGGDIAARDRHRPRRQ